MLDKKLQKHIKGGSLTIDRLPHCEGGPCGKGWYGCPLWDACIK